MSSDLKLFFHLFPQYRLLGGKGSGHTGHKGRVGKEGGSLPKGQQQPIQQARSITVEDSTTFAHEKRFLKGRVTKEDILDVMESWTHAKTDKVEVKFVKRYGQDGSQYIFSAYMDKRTHAPNAGWGHVVTTVFHENGRVEIYSNSKSAWEQGYKEYAIPMISKLKDRGFDYMTVPVPDPAGASQFKYGKVKLSMPELGGKGSGHESHAGRPGLRGGSLPKGSSKVTQGQDPEHFTAMAMKFNEMEEDATSGSAKNKRWRKNHQEDYTNDPQFRAAADYVSLYTQGSYDEMKAIAYHEMTGEWPEGMHNWEDSSVPDWVDEDLGIVSNPMATYKNYFEGQNLEGELGIATKDAAMVVEKTIANSPPLEYSLFRGVTGSTLGEHIPNPDPERAEWEPTILKYKKWPPIPEVGSTIDFVGATSFTKNAETARGFAERSVRGISNKGLGWGSWATFTYEIQPGARGIEVSALSPWGQQEVLTSGRYEVMEVFEHEIPSWKKTERRGGDSHKVPHYVVKLKQVGTWDID